MALRSASQLCRSATLGGLVVTLVCLPGLMPRSLQAAGHGVEELSSRISPVDACNRAQGQRPAGAVVTDMHVARHAQPGEPLQFNCRISWSTAADAEPTRRPILFGPTR